MPDCACVLGKIKVRKFSMNSSSFFLDQFVSPFFAMDETNQPVVIDNVRDMGSRSSSSSTSLAPPAPDRPAATTRARCSQKKNIFVFASSAPHQHPFPVALAQYAPLRRRRRTTVQADSAAARCIRVIYMLCCVSTAFFSALQPHGPLLCRPPAAAVAVAVAAAVRLAVAVQVQGGG